MRRGGCTRRGQAQLYPIPHSCRQLVYVRGRHDHNVRRRRVDRRQRPPFGQGEVVEVPRHRPDIEAAVKFAEDAHAQAHRPLEGRLVVKADEDPEGFDGEHIGAGLVLQDLGNGSGEGGHGGSGGEGDVTTGAAAHGRQTDGSEGGHKG